jgi:hypothetical protein
MGKIEKLEADVKALSPAEQAAFRDWYMAFEADRWDAQIKSDAEGGKLDVMAQQAIADYKDNKTRLL